MARERGEILEKVKKERRWKRRKNIWKRLPTPEENVKRHVQKRRRVQLLLFSLFFASRKKAVNQLSGEIVSSTLLGSSYPRHSLRFSVICCCCSCVVLSLMSDAIKRQLVSQSDSQLVAVGLFSELYFSVAAFWKKGGEKGADKVCLARTDFAHVRRAQRTRHCTLHYTTAAHCQIKLAVFSFSAVFILFWAFRGKNRFVNDRLKVGI